MYEKLHDKAHYYAQKGYSDLVASLVSAASLSILGKGMSVSEGIAKLKDAFKSYVNKNALMASNLVISENLNGGRKYAFDEYEEDTYAYQWSALLDGGTCNYCRSMDGRTISASDKLFNSYQPGRVHFNCRCIWVAILKDETPVPIFTGIPEALKPQTEVPPWNFEDLNTPLPGSSKIDIAERLAPVSVGGKTIDYGIDTYKEKGK